MTVEVLPTCDCVYLLLRRVDCYYRIHDIRICMVILLDREDPSRVGGMDAKVGEAHLGILRYNRSGLVRVNVKGENGVRNRICEDQLAIRRACLNRSSPIFMHVCQCTVLRRQHVSTLAIGIVFDNCSAPFLRWSDFEGVELARLLLQLPLSASHVTVMRLPDSHSPPPHSIPQLQLRRYPQRSCSS